MCHWFKVCFSVHILWHKWSHCLCWGVGQITLAVGLCTFALAQQMSGKEWNMGRGAAPVGFVQIFVFLYLSMCFLIGPPSTNLAPRLVLSLFGAAAGAFLQGPSSKREEWQWHVSSGWTMSGWFCPIVKKRTCAHSRRSFPWPSCQWLLRGCRHLSPKISHIYTYLTIHQYIIWNANHWNTNHENWSAQFQHSQIKPGQVAPPMSTFAMLPRRIVDQSLATQIGPIALLGLRNARMLNVNFDITPVHFCWGIWDTWWAVMV